MKKIFVYLFLIFTVILLAQEPPRQQAQRITIKQANEMRGDEKLYPGAQILVGDVVFEHEGMTLTTDSAVFLRNENHFNAYGNVHMTQGDTVELNSGSLFYDGQTKIMKANQNVSLRNKNTTLYTDTLEYDRVLERGSYFTGGIIKDSLNTLSSVIGIYYMPDDLADFFIDVQVLNPDVRILTDTLRYYTETKIAEVQGPSNIYNKENIIYAERGYYDTNEELANFNLNPVITFDKRLVYADSIHYDSKLDFASAVRNLLIRDTISNTLIYGDYGELWNALDSAIIPQNPRVVYLSENDTMYMRADTIMITNKLVEVPDTLGASPVDTLLPSSDSLSLAAADSLGAAVSDSPVAPPADMAVAAAPVSAGESEEESGEDGTGETPDSLKNIKTRIDTVKQLRAYRNVRIFMRDLSGKSDSLYSDESSGRARMFYDPIMWSGRNQIVADTIEFTRSPQTNAIDSVILIENAFIISQDNEPGQFNQIKGKYVRGKMADGQMRKVRVLGNAQTIYYAYDSNDQRIGINRAEGSYIQAFLKDNRIERISFIQDPTAQLYRFSELPEKDRLLSNFNWRPDERIRNPEQVWGGPIDVEFNFNVKPTPTPLEQQDTLIMSVLPPQNPADSLAGIIPAVRPGEDGKATEKSGGKISEAGKGGDQPAALTPKEARRLKKEQKKQEKNDRKVLKEQRKEEKKAAREKEKMLKKEKKEQKKDK